MIEKRLNSLSKSFGGNSMSVRFLPNDPEVGGDMSRYSASGT